MSERERIEQSITKTYRRDLWVPFIDALKKYALIGEGDRICVCVSGGKDSMLLAKLMQMLQRHSDVPFSLEYLVMDPGYSPAHLQQIKENAEKLGLPLQYFEKRLFKVVGEAGGAPCYLCARMRRGALYERARALGCNKIALGHHFNDVIETTLLGMFYSSQLQGMMPRLASTNFEGMELIRPLYCVREDAIVRWAEENGLAFLACACPLSEGMSAVSSEAPADAAGGLAEVTQSDSKRAEVKALLRELRKTNPDIEKSIFNSLHAVSLDTFPGYKGEGAKLPTGSGSLYDLSKEQLIELIELYAKDSLALDGVWFQAVEQADGMDAAIDRDAAAWERFTAVEARRIKRFLGLEESPGLEGLEAALRLRFLAHVNDAALSREGDRLVYTIRKCRVQNARAQKGLPYHPCKPVGTIEYAGFAKAIDERIVCRCVSCYPEVEDASCACKWEFTLAVEESPQIDK